MLDIEDVVPPGVSPEIEGCLNLWAAKLHVHIDDVLSNTQGALPFKQSSEIWMFLSDESTVGSFRWICDLFGIDPDILRDHIRPGWRKDFKRYKAPTARTYQTIVWSEIIAPKQDSDKYEVPVFLGGRK